MSRTIISTPDAPAAIGPYNQAVKVGSTLYCSGQIPLDPATGTMVTGSITVQTERVLDNLAAVLQAAGMDWSHVVRCTVYLADMGDFAEMNAVYGRYMGDAPPARVTVEVTRLPKDAGIEISCIAVQD